ncbi:MAG: ABC transporter ATP-binding protein [Bacteroidota bacterium]
MPNKVLLTIRSLSTSFREDGEWKKAIEDINLELKSRETHAIVGESGSGKSVTSLSVTRLLPKGNSKIEEGELIFNEINLREISEKEMRNLRGQKIAMIFQEPMTSLNPVEKCGKQVAEILRLHKGISKSEAKDNVLSLFTKVRLPDPELLYKKYPFELSGGQKQRVMIAMAIACEPDVLIADEPTTALDPSVSRSILELIKDLQADNGMAVLFITHDLESLRGFADTISVMYKGQIIEQGPSDIVLSNPREKYTKALLACRPPKNSKPFRLPTVAEIMSDSFHEKESPKMTYDEPLLEVEHIKYWYPVKKGFPPKTINHIKAVDGVSFSLMKGESLGVVGESGCGKSTLGRLLAGLLIEHEGELFLNGKNRASLNKKAWKEYRKRVQIIFQDPYSALNPKIKIGNAIAEPLIAHRILGRQEAKKNVLKMLEKVGLKAEFFNRYPHEFSGGQRQRIGIARSLILNPEIVICDESVSALDVSVQAQILNLLNDLKDQLGLTYFFISHDMDVVNYFCDRVMQMENGKINFIEKGEGILA